MRLRDYNDSYLSEKKGAILRSLRKGGAEAPTKKGSPHQEDFKRPDKIGSAGC